MSTQTAKGNKIQIVLTEGLKSVEYFVQKVMIPGFSFGVTEIPTGSTKLNIVGDTIDFEDLTVSLILDEDLKAWKEVHADMMQKDPETGNMIPSNREYDINIIILSSKNNPILNMKFKDSKIRNVGGISYDVTTSEELFFDITFAYDYSTIEDL